MLRRTLRSRPWRWPLSGPIPLAPLLDGARARMLRLHVWPRAEVLFEVADGAGDELVLVRCEGDEGYEADCEEGPIREDKLVGVGLVDLGKGGGR